MSDRDLLGMAVYLNPGDQLTRLVMADYLDDHGESGDSLRSERGAVEISYQFPGGYWVENPDATVYWWDMSKAEPDRTYTQHTKLVPLSAVTIERCSDCTSRRHLFLFGRWLCLRCASRQTGRGALIR